MRTLLFGQISSVQSSSAYDISVQPMGVQIGAAEKGSNNYEELTTSVRNDLRIPIDGVLQNFYIKRSVAATTSTNSFDFKNITTGITNTLTITSGQNSAYDNSTQIAVNAGDSIRFLFHNNENVESNFSWSCQFVANESNKTFMSGGLDYYANQSQDGTYYYSPICYSQREVTSGTETKKRFYCPTAGTITAFHVRKYSANNFSTLTWSIMKNGIEEASSIVTTPGAGGTVLVSATGLSISFVAGDSLTVKYILSNSNGSHIMSNWVIEYSPTIDGEQMIGWLQEQSSSNTQNEVQYGYINGATDIYGIGNFQTTSEARRQIYLAGFTTATLKKFRVNIESAPGTGETREYRVRVNGANGNQVIDISNSDTSGSDSTNIETLASGDLINITHEVL